MRRKHLVILALSVPVLLLMLYLGARHSDAYGKAKRFVSRDSRISSLIGPVHRVDFRFWRGFSVTGHDADFTFLATGGGGSYIVDVRLRHRHGAWRVHDADIRTGDGYETDLMLH